MPISLKARLCLMMFLNYVIWGAWYVTIGTYLTATLKFSGTEAGAVFGTTALASMISPFFMGLIADRFFATEKVLAVLHLMGRCCSTPSRGPRVSARSTALMLAYCLCFFPTIALTNSLTLRQLTDAGGEFPFIRMFATIGWIVIGLTIGSMGDGNDGDAVSAGGGRLRGDGALLPDAAAHAARGQGPEDHGRARCSGWMRW